MKVWRRAARPAVFHPDHRTGEITKKNSFIPTFEAGKLLKTNVH